MSFIETVENKKIKARKDNIEEVFNNINAPQLLDKIYKHCNRFSGVLSAEEIIQSLKNRNVIIASLFAKDPGRQNISEKLASETLKVPKLPPKGKNCIRFNDNGDIVSDAINATKSADFKINDYYATQKYTGGKGGAQGNQKGDVIDFLKRGSLKHKVMAIVDGTYWDGGCRDELKQIFKDNKNVVITSVDELVERGLNVN